MFQAAIAQAECYASITAARAAARRLKERLGKLEPKVCIVFADCCFAEPGLLEEVAAVFPGVPLMGCTTSGDITSDLGFSDDSVSILAFVSDTISMGVGLGVDTSRDSIVAARQAIDQASRGLDGEPVLCFALTDPSRSNWQHYPRELARLLGPGCPVVGGFAGQEINPEKGAAVFHGKDFHTDALVVLLFSGPLTYAYSVSNSWKPLGMKVRVEESDGTQVRRMGGMRALDFYRRHAGERAEPGPEIPLAVYDDSGGFYVRSPQNIFSEAEGYIEYTSDVPQGMLVQLTEASREGILENTASSIEELAASFPDDSAPVAALLVSCAARKNILGTRTPRELDTVRRVLGAGTGVFGFYSFGEVAPLRPGGLSFGHNCTLVTLLLGEAGQLQPPALGEVELPLSCNGGGDESERLERENQFLRRKLARSEGYRVRLEELKDKQDSLFRRVNEDINDARLKIKHKNALLRQALALAQEVQQRLLPSRAPLLEHLDVAGKSLYCDETGGDYFDYLVLPGGDQGRVDLVVGDVTGHGIAAALLMTTARALVRMRATQAGSIAQRVTDINRLLTPDVWDSGRFMTLFYLSLDPLGKNLAWVRAGHDPAMVFDPATGEFEELVGAGMALGISGDSDYQEFRHQGLAPGQVILVGTDGIWEARNIQGEMYGKERLKEVVRNAAQGSCRELIDEVLGDLEDFRTGVPAEDDVTLVMAKLKS